MTDQIVPYNAMTTILNHLDDIEETTREDYRLRLPQFVQFVQGFGLNKETFRAYKRFVKNQNSKISTKKKYFTVARRILQELHVMGHLPTDITLGVRGFKSDSRHKKFGFTTDEVQGFSAFILSLPKSPINMRIRAFYFLLSGNVLRQTEVLRLDVEDLNLAEGSMMVLRKHRKEKEPVLIYPDAIPHIKAHLKFNNIRTGPIFRSLGNKHGQDARLTRQQMWNDVKKVIGETDKTPHGLRHHGFTVLLRGGMSTDDVMKYTGIRDRNTITSYQDDLKTESAMKDGFDILQKAGV